MAKLEAESNFISTSTLLKAKITAPNSLIIDKASNSKDLAVSNNLANISGLAFNLASNLTLSAIVAPKSS